MNALDVGLHLGVPEEVYHRDPAIGISLSSSIAKILIEQSPAHAHFNHPRLNPAFEDRDEREDKAKDRGSAFHKMLLGVGQRVCVLDYPDYKTKAAREARDAARANNEIPLLMEDHEIVVRMVEAARQQVDAMTELRGIFDDGDAEVTGVWKERDVWCRMRLDWLPRAARAGGHITAIDLKSTGRSAYPDDYVRHFFEMGYDVQSAFYERGLRKLLPSVRTVQFVFIVIEQDPPFGLTAMELGGQALEEAREKVDLAIETWRACMRDNRWPLYGAGINTLDPPTYKSMAHELRKRSMQNRLAAWQAPHDK